MSIKKSHKTLFEHLEDFRILVMKCVSIFILGCTLVGCFFPFCAKILNYPLNKALSIEPSSLQGLVTTSPMGIFSVLIQVCFLGGFALSLPFMLYFTANFIAPGLTKKEKSILTPSCIAILTLFLIGAAFSYFYVLPATLSVSIQLNQIFGFELIWSAPMYYGLVVWMTLGIGLCFEFPLVLLLLVHLRILSSQKLRAIRRHMIVGILITSGFMTPSSDPLSLIMLASPLYVMYEVAILIGVYIEKKRKNQEFLENIELEAENLASEQ